MMKWTLGVLVLTTSVVALSVGCGVALPGLGADATAGEVVDASRAAMRGLSSFAFASESRQEGEPDSGAMVIAAEWAGRENHKATVSPPYTDIVIEVIVVDGVGHSRSAGEAWTGNLTIDLTGTDWAAVPDLPTPRFLADEVIGGVPVYHIAGTVTFISVDGDVTRTFESAIDLYISKRDLRLLRQTGRGRIVSVVGATASDDDNRFNQIFERTYSRFNEVFEITAPIIPTATPLPTRTPRPS